MIVVLDTNVLLVSFPSKSRYRPIFDVFVNGKILFVIPTTIYLEYLEIIANHAKLGVAEYFKDFLRAAENVITPEVHYHWNLIVADPDDNKFTDAYIAAGADYWLPMMHISMK